MRRVDPNLTILARAVTRLGPLTDRMVFLGGCVTSLLLTDPAAPEVRPTLDVDVMPTDERVFGFGNRWYRPALANAQRLVLPSGERIRAVTAPYFLATKLEAFAGRGGGDYQASADLEDIVTVVDGRIELSEEVRLVEPALRQYLVECFSRLLATHAFVEALPAHLPPDAASQARLPILLDRLRRLAKQQL